ncbi:Protein FAR1-RELATED SEQUENCE [Abeliophyllum distichum]|uniref:Protein FAR1-RELATED SEQUENCE n=1 Tax=Abeliophyllum distichum TaxID=126358 RepID=A0ABD1UHT0_9LAMI
MEIDAGGLDSVGYVERDLRNHQRNIREELKGHDAETLIEYFSFEKEKSPNFYFDYDTDSDNKLVHDFWADSESRRSYAFFGDAVVFDTTYNTNKYSMIFVPFVGVNHHGQTVLFGCRLLSDESTESFVWLLSKFMDAMPGDTPQIIITDHGCGYCESYINDVTFDIPQMEGVVVLLCCHDMGCWPISRRCWLMMRSLTDARMSFLMEEFVTLHLRIKDIDDGGHVGLSRDRNKNAEERIAICDPSFVRAKGCGKRLKSSKEKSMAKNSRQCSTCGQHGHDKRTCPTLVGRSTMETYQQELNDQVLTQQEGRSEATFMSYASSQCEMGNWFL